MDIRLYEYEGVITKIVDADTVWISVDVGFCWSGNIKFRLARINAPEIRGKEREAGLRSKDFLKSIIPIGSRVFLKSYKNTRGTQKKGSMDRYIIDLYTSDGVNVNDLLVNKGFAQFVDYS